MIACICGGLIEGAAVAIGAAGLLSFRCVRAFLVGLWKELRR